MSEDNNQVPPAPKVGDKGDTTPPKNEDGNTVPQARLNEVTAQKNAANEKADSANERADLWKKRAEEAASENEAEKAKNAQLVEDGKGKDRSAWRANALQSINPEVAKIAADTGITFTGETQEEYSEWAKNLEVTILPRLKQTKADVDGNRGGADSQEMTAEQLAKMTPEERLEHGKKTLPHHSRD